MIAIKNNKNRAVCHYSDLQSSALVSCPDREDSRLQTSPTNDPLQMVPYKWSPTNGPLQMVPHKQSPTNGPPQTVPYKWPLPYKWPPTNSPLQMAPHEWPPQMVPPTNGPLKWPTTNSPLQMVPYKYPYKPSPTNSPPQMVSYKINGPLQKGPPKNDPSPFLPVTVTRKLLLLALVKPLCALQLYCPRSISLM